jgi:two-component system sensor histidine kinase BaeS
MWLGGLLFLLFGLLMVAAVIALIVTIVVGVAKAVWFLMPVLVVVAVIAIGRSAGRTWTPVRGLIDAAGSLADGDYTVRVPESGPPSMRPVVSSFNRMAKRLEEAEEQRRRLIADVGHELRTPLTVVRGEIEAMLDGVHQADPDHLEQLLEEVGVMERLLEDLRTLSLAESGALALHPEPADVGELVRDVAAGQRRAAEAAGVVVTVKVGPEVGEAVVDPVRVREVVSNLMVNALRAMPDGGALTLAVGIALGKIVIDVRDTGMGIDPDDVDAMFERFRKGSTSSGSGLGLTISRDLVEAHGGSITIDSEPGAGTTVRVRLPLIRA